MKGRFKEEKAFRPWDILVYIAVIAIIACIALIVFLPKKGGEILETKIFYGENLLYSYSFVTKTGKVTEYGRSFVEENVENGIVTVTITTEKGKNVAEIGKTYVKMTEADCSRHPDCVEKFSALTKGNETIICLPHEIKIVSYGEMSNEVKI